MIANLGQLLDKSTTLLKAYRYVALTYISLLKQS
jgi:hypothetical protein